MKTLIWQRDFPMPAKNNEVCQKSLPNLDAKVERETPIGVEKCNVGQKFRPRKRKKVDLVSHAGQNRVISAHRPYLPPPAGRGIREVGRQNGLASHISHTIRTG